MGFGDFVKNQFIDVIEYDLPLEENHTRNLIVIKQQL